MAFRRYAICCILAVGAGVATAQDIDANITLRNRQSLSIADEIRNPAEKAAFLQLYRTRDPRTMLQLATRFLDRFPGSAFLAPVYEIAAKASFDTGGLAPGIDYARKSLALLPENPLLRVALADVEARQKINDAAIADAKQALEDLDTFARPVSISEQEWSSVQKKQKSMALFALGRAQLQKSLDEPRGSAPRRETLGASLQSLARARTLQPDDEEIQYLHAMALISSGALMKGAGELAVCATGGSLAPRAMEALRAIYAADTSHREPTFEEFLQHARSMPPLEGPSSPEEPKARGETVLSTYAGSQTCRACHAEIYTNWSRTGMATMLRPYKFENVTGDFEKDNEFFTGDDTEYVHGKLTSVAEGARQLFARMFISSGRHYFKILEPNGIWQTYRVDYTIGSKWQQAYATELPNGEIHVFPIQWSMRQKRWINYWRSLDGPGTERANPHNFERLDSATSYQDKCAICHTSQLRNTTGGGLESNHLQFREPGVGCEMCHGPSADHVAAMDNGEASPTPADEPPVDFKRIGNRQFVDICSQCHMQSAIRTPGAHGELNYSPAETFYQKSLSVPFGEFTRKGFYKDGRFSQTTFIVEALRRTKCFRIGDVSCGTCHEPAWPWF